MLSYPCHVILTKREENSHIHYLLSSRNWENDRLGNWERRQEFNSGVIDQAWMNREISWSCSNRWWDQEDGGTSSTSQNSNSSNRYLRSYLLRLLLLPLRFLVFHSIRYLLFPGTTLKIYQSHGANCYCKLIGFWFLPWLIIGYKIQFLICPSICLINCIYIEADWWMKIWGAVATLLSRRMLMVVVVAAWLM